MFKRGRMIKDKRGWIKIVEAFMAIILVTGIIFIILSGRVGNKFDKDEAIHNLQKTVLDEISGSEELRRAVLSEDYATLRNFISTRIPGVLGFDIKVCELDKVCNLEVYKEELYVDERVISSSLLEYSPKKLRLFMWEK